MDFVSKMFLLLPFSFSRYEVYESDGANLFEERSHVGAIDLLFSFGFFTDFPRDGRRSFDSSCESLHLAEKQLLQRQEQHFDEEKKLKKTFCELSARR